MTKRATAGGTQGVLMMIGGHEDKKGKRTILSEIARRVHGGKLVIATVASQEPHGYFKAYKEAFADLGVGALAEVYVEDRAEALHDEQLRALKGAAGVFFTGGDQLRITSQIGNTPIEKAVREIFDGGGLIAGTSAGASVMPEIMLVKGSSQESYRAGGLSLAPGLGLIAGVIIDQHFAQRGRIGRLIGAMAQNPRLLGIGIDEDTAIIVKDRAFTVIGNGAVYVMDAAGVTHSNIAEEQQDQVVSIYDLRLHVLASGEHFCLEKRRPSEDLALRASQRLETKAMEKKPVTAAAKRRTRRRSV